MTIVRDGRGFVDLYASLRAGGGRIPAQEYKEIRNQLISPGVNLHEHARFMRALDGNVDWNEAGDFGYINIIRPKT